MIRRKSLKSSKGWPEERKRERGEDKFKGNGDSVKEFKKEEKVNIKNKNKVLKDYRN